MKKLLTPKTTIIALILVFLAGILAFALKRQKASAPEYFTASIGS